MSPSLPSLGNATPEHLGLTVVKEVVTRPAPDGMGFLFRTLSELDFGIDGQIEIVEHNGGVSSVTGKILSVQVKAGASYFEHEKTDCWTVYIEKETVNYWRSHSVPVILTIVDLNTRSAFWVHADSPQHTELTKTFRIDVPKSQRLNASACATLKDLAEHTTPEVRKFAQLESDYPMIATAEAGHKVSVDIALWHNKSSGRMDYWIGTPGKPAPGSDGPNDLKSFASGSLIGTNGDPLSAIALIAPWAEGAPDDEFYDGMEEDFYQQYLAEHGTWDSEDSVYIDGTGTFEIWKQRRKDASKNGIQFYEDEGEVSRYRIDLKLNQVGKSFITLRTYLKHSDKS